MTPREQQIEQVRLLSDEDINEKILEFCADHNLNIGFSKFTKSLNAMRALEDYSFCLYRWHEMYEDLLEEVKDPKTPVWNVLPRHKAEAFILASNLL